jgi:6-pyruvoyltetrahydropterin/6-carboxytetrahydropterin synthase
MFRLRVESTFDAAHQIVDYKGKCSKLHGHTWKVEAFVVGNELDNVGLLMDFGLMKKKLHEITDKLDHTFLNESKEVGNPTSENIARYIFQNMKNLPQPARLEKVRVWESIKSWCEYFES